jgi:4-alpha-glucanotransferase
MLATVDVIRIDHFRGFQACWEIQAEHPTAEHGRWVPAPGREVFAAARNALGRLPIIVEDLGVITPDVEALRYALGYPGMKVLQFAFDGGPENPFLPHHFERDVVVYTGTHDNDTTVGWWEARSEAERDYARRYLGTDGHDIAWDLIRLALASVADLAIIPLQDVLELGTATRMNFPSRPEGNWAWRVRPGELTPAHAARLRDLAATYGRIPA